MGRLKSFEIWTRRQRLHGGESSLLTFSIFIFLILFSFASPLQGARTDNNNNNIDKECKSIANLIKNKDFTYPWWEDGGGLSSQRGQLSASSTSSSPSCPIGRNGDKSIKCCRELNSTLQRREMGEKFNEKWLGPKLAANGDIFKERKKKFDVTFKDVS
jgi:hypothetical protein